MKCFRGNVRVPRLFRIAEVWLKYEKFLELFHAV